MPWRRNPGDSSGSGKHALAGTPLLSKALQRVTSHCNCVKEAMCAFVSVTDTEGMSVLGGVPNHGACCDIVDCIASKFRRQHNATSLNTKQVTSGAPADHIVWCVTPF